jgi:hypothetical protein
MRQRPDLMSGANRVAAVPSAGKPSSLQGIPVEQIGSRMKE